MEELITEYELCEWLKIHVTTAYRWRIDGMPFKKVNRSIRYDPKEVQKWIDEKSK